MLDKVGLMSSWSHRTVGRGSMFMMVDNGGLVSINRSYSSCRTVFSSAWWPTVAS